MTTPDNAEIIDWRDAHAPRSALYGDVYFCSDDGLAESQAVFLDGCGLPDAWAGRRRFTVGELGFGTGLNIAALLMRWRAHRPPDAYLHIFSVEAHPIGAADAERALVRWPEIAQAAQALLAAWPPATPGFHRLDLPDFGAVLDLAVMDAAAALAAWDGRADSWLLDGFSPALNPAMWTPELMQAVANHSAPGARAATFTVAGSVRRGLADAGFAVDRLPGFGRKRQRLEAVFPGPAPADPPIPSVAVIGAGIAGAALARALRAMGAEPAVFEADGIGAGASGNPAALVTPAFDAGEGARARLYAQTHRRAVALLQSVDGAVIARGAVQMEATERDAARFDKVAASPLFDSLTRIEGGMAIADALVVEPAPVLAAWTCGVSAARVERLERGADGWRLHAAGGESFGPFEAVALAAGADLARLWRQAPVRSVRGQASWADGLAPDTPTAFGGYAVPTRTGMLFGATHDRGDEGEDLREADHRRNLDLLAQGLPGLAAAAEGLPLRGRARRRAATPDRMPMAGAVPGMEGIHVLGGLGSRGFCTAPLLAEHVAARIVGAASPLPLDLTAAVDPMRPALRDKR